MSEILLPDGNIAGNSDWVKTGSAPDSNDATYTEIDEGIAGDADTTYIEQPNNSITFSDTKNFSFANPVGTPNTASGSNSWALLVRAKKTAAEAPVFNFSLYQGTTLIAGPSEPTLTTSYAQYTLLFDPAAISDVNDLRLRVVGSASFGGSIPRITAAQLNIEVVTPSSSKKQAAPFLLLRRK